MEESLIKEKAKDTASIVAGRCGVDYAAAFRVTERVWEEARRALLAMVSAEDWRKLTFPERAEVCRMVVKGLLDRKRLLAFLNGERRSIL